MPVYVTPAFANQSPSGAETYRLSVQGPDFRLAPNFTLVEFACRCGSHAECDAVTVGGVRYHDVVIVHPALVLALQAARYWFDAAVRVTSGYRPAWYNGDVDGAVENSTHITGLGVDVTIAGVLPAEVASFFREALGAGGVGLYDDGHVHVSVGNEGGTDRRFGREWRAVYDPSVLDDLMPELAPVAAALGVRLGRGGPSASDDGRIWSHLAGLGGGAGGWIAAGLAVTLAVRAVASAAADHHSPRALRHRS